MDTRTPEQELANQRGVLGSLVSLAAEVRECANVIAAGIEGVAWELDRERRGDLSVGARQDAAELADTVCRLLNDPLLDAEGLEQLHRRVRSMLCPDLQPVGRSPDAQEKARRGRRAT